MIAGVSDARSIVADNKAISEGQVAKNNYELHVSYTTKLSGVRCVPMLPVANNLETDSAWPDYLKEFT
jgi:hypothetical protein